MVVVGFIVVVDVVSVASGFVGEVVSIVLVLDCCLCCGGGGVVVVIAVFVVIIIAVLCVLLWSLVMVLM